MEKLVGKRLGEMLERGENEGVVIELSERGAAVEERWNRRSRRWGSRMRGGGGARQEVQIGHVASKYLLLYHHIT